MKTLLKIKRINIYANGNTVIVLRNGLAVVPYKEHYENTQTGEIMEPVYDEFTEELIGFIANF